MLNPQKLVIRHFVRELKTAYQRTYGIMEQQFGDIIAWTGRLALENIANSDSLYHDVEHTMQWIANLHAHVFDIEHDKY